MRNCIPVAEDAQNLIRNVNYEVPSLKKLSAKYEQQMSDLERSIEASKKQSKNYLHEFNSSIKKLGIEVCSAYDARENIFGILLNIIFIYSTRVPISKANSPHSWKYCRPS